MKIDYSAITNTFFAQAYGGDSYGTQQYGGCTQTADGCIPNTTTGAPGAPNTGFLGLSPDAAVASGAGALLVAVAIAGVITVFTRRRTRKNKTQE
ncbi:MAG: hypothetical protein ACOH18_00400 [Candidatus Saccharimonadaceae bacterium]